jgi:hypothetical protein
MEFTLTYRGPLTANGSAKDKQKIRDYLHFQMKELWDYPPLSGKHNLITAQAIPENEGICLLESRAGFEFVALVSSKFHLAADLHIIFLRNGKPGESITRGGDLDNRIKTLFDALALPTDGQISSAPPELESRETCFCLLEDDKLIYNFTIETDRLLYGSGIHVAHTARASHPEHEVLLLIRVKTRTTQLQIWNMDI